MTEPRPLSPAAQRVMDAALNTPIRATHIETRHAQVAAALRAAATTLKPGGGQSHQVGGILSARRQLLAIANELDPND